MEGNSIDVAKDALKLFIRSLPSGSFFNVYSFGSTTQKLFDSISEYDQKIVDEALAKIDTFSADLGGTEIYTPLNDIFTNDSDLELNKHVFIITDGEIFNPDTLYKLIEKNNKDFTVHTIGIGSGVSIELIEKCAFAGGGKSYFVNNQADGLKGKVIDALSKAFQPNIKINQRQLDVTLEIGNRVTYLIDRMP